ncbi:hypothetical protein [Kitasatospora purpeofusca]|uniref:hypothetical protein n=1 Tax=Kitasatospora purpeofusca TaxID=67352 RepID=UPI003668978A
MRRTSLAAATTAALLLAAGTATVVPARAATADSCGGSVSDYVGLAGLDLPFIGTASSNGNDRALSISPVTFGVNSFKTEIATGPTDSRYAVGPFELRVDTTGRGTITFVSYAGHGIGDSVVCGNGGTRVTKISGAIRVQDVSKRIPFTVSRT